jgi:O-antigen ligase
MNRPKAEAFIRKYFVYGIALVSMIVTPRMILDPINAPKMLLLFILSTAGVFLIAPHLGFYIKGKARILLIFTAVYILDLLLILLFADSDFGQQIYGTFGRNNGILAYLGLMFVFLLGALTSNVSSVARFLHGFIFVSIASGVYGILQSQKIDPAGFLSLYSSAIGFLGNPDFFSAFHGLALVASLGMLILIKEKKSLRYIYLISTLINVYALKIAGAKQGVLVAVIGIAIMIVILAYQRNKVLGLSLTSVGFFGFVFIALGLVNSGPLASLIYKSSLEARGYYWGAAWKMTVDHPFFGVGIDNLGSWYRRARSDAAYQWLPTQETNAAHNVFLDFSSNGGFPFLVLNLGLVALVLLSFFSTIRKSEKLNPYYIIGFSMWVAFQAQLLISINQIGNAVWGWALGGILLGYSYFAIGEPGSDKAEKISKRRNVQKSDMLPASDLLRLTAGAILAIIIALPYWSSAVNFQGAIASQSLEKIEQAAIQKPFDAVRMLGSARVLKDNGKVDQARAILDLTVQAFPDSYGAWEEFSKLPGISEDRMKEIKAELSRLDPRAPVAP